MNKLRRRISLIMATLFVLGIGLLILLLVSIPNILIPSPEPIFLFQKIVYYFLILPVFLADLFLVVLMIALRRGLDLNQQWRGLGAAITTVFSAAMFDPTRS